MANASDKTFLHIDEDDTFREQLLLMTNPTWLDDHAEPTKTVKPEPGFCVKTKDDAGRKVFINICKSTELPPPKDINEDELIRMLESDDPGLYKVPMSLGDPHWVKDKGGNDTTAFDIVINTTFYQKILSSLVFKTFLITVCMDGLEDKHKINLDRNGWVVLKNKTYFGEIQEITIKNKPKPLITELNTTPVVKIKEINEATSENQSKVVVPQYSLEKVESQGLPKTIYAEIKLPNIKNATDVTLDVGEDHIVMRASSNKDLIYELDIFLPIDIDPDRTTAEFHKADQVLKMTMPTTHFG